MTTTETITLEIEAMKPETRTVRTQTKDITTPIEPTTKNQLTNLLTFFKKTFKANYCLINISKECTERYG